MASQELVQTAPGVLLVDAQFEQFNDLVFFLHGPGLADKGRDPWMVNVASAVASRGNYWQPGLPLSIAVFVKYPEPGQVKSRLAASIGPGPAAHFFRLSTLKLLKNLQEFRSQIAVYYDPRHPCSDYQDWLGHDLCYHPQSSGELGRRLASASAALAGEGKRAMVFLGGDAPTVGVEHVQHCLELLREPGRVVLGPTPDGGYYLLGQAAHTPRLFEEIPWSTERVAELTAQRARECGLEIHRLSEQQDVDTWDDLESLRPQLKTGPLAQFLKDLPPLN